MQIEPVTSINSDDFTQADFFESESPDLFEKALRFSAYLDDWRSKGTYTYHRCITTATANRLMIKDSAVSAGRHVINMASNNYLGLSVRPEIRAAAYAAIERYGSGLSGSRFLSGTYDLITELEARLAAFEHKEAAMVFTTGYQANVGAISALARPGDIVFMDRLSHASIVDGCRLAGCDYRTFRHNDANHLDAVLRKTSAGHRCKLVVAEAVFSMDGDLAPLADLVEVAGRHGARVMVDEAHATGVLGPTGRGASELFGIEDRVDIVLGTFSKAMAATGGFIAASREVISYVRHYARSYIFSASPTPATIASVLAALEILDREPDLRLRLLENVRYFHGELRRLGFDVRPERPESGIVTIVVGPDAKIRNVSRSVYEAGLFTGSAAYPAVPKDESRLRLCLSAQHTRKDVDDALRILAIVGREHGLIPSAAPAGSPS
jgi:8-amino-7-oxononanoate synthase